jgi:hypothetical protein
VCSQQPLPLPVLIGAGIFVVVLIIGAVIFAGSGDDPAESATPTPSPPPPATTPPPPPPPPLVLGSADCAPSSCTGSGICVDGNIQCVPDPVVAELTFPGDIESMGLSDPDSQTYSRFEIEFSENVGSALNIPSGNVIVISIDPSSIKVTFAILPTSNNLQVVEGSGSPFLYDPADKLLQLASLASDSTSALYSEGSKFQELGVPLTTPVAIPDDLLSDTCEQLPPACTRAPVAAFLEQRQLQLYRFHLACH